MNCISSTENCKNSGTKTCKQCLFGEAYEYTKKNPKYLLCSQFTHVTTVDNTCSGFEERTVNSYGFNTTNGMTTKEINAQKNKGQFQMF